MRLNERLNYNEWYELYRQLFRELELQFTDSSMNSTADAKMKPINALAFEGNYPTGSTAMMYHDVAHYDEV